MMKVQTVGVIVFLAVLVAVVEMREIFEFQKPHKYYRPRPSRFRTRNRHTRRPAVYGTCDGNPSSHRHYRREPQRDTWQPYYTGTGHVESEPYAIEIKLPKRHESRPWTRDPYNRNYGYDSVEDFYNDEDEPPMQTIAKGIQIKVVKGSRPKLQIKLSRDDTEEQITGVRS